MAMNGSSPNKVDIGRDLLLKSGGTWIDAIADLLESLHLEASVCFAFDGGEAIALRNGEDQVCVLAARPWGMFVTLGRSFYISNLEGGVAKALAIVAEVTLSGWHLLPDRLKLEEFRFLEFVDLGRSYYKQHALLEDGWAEMSDRQYLELTHRYGLEFHSLECVPIDLHAVLPNCEYAQGSLRTTQDLFHSNRTLFWYHENLVRRRFVDALMYFGDRCSMILCFRVNHDSYVLQIPADGWGYLADATWPDLLTAPGGRALLFAPDIHQALVTDETQGTIIGYGREIAVRLASLFRETPSIWTNRNE